MHRIILCRALPEAGMAVFAGRSDLDVVTLTPPAEADLARLAPDASAILAWVERIGPELFLAAPRLRVISRLGVGFDTVDLTAATARGVPVMVVNGTNDLTVAEHAMALMLGCARQVALVDADVRGGTWQATGLRRTVDLAGRRVLVVGFGRIGVRVARLCAAFGMRVAVYDPLYPPPRIAAGGFIPETDLHRALARADVVTLHCPLKPETRHLMNGPAFAALKPGAMLINTARGGVVEEPALIAALRSGHLAAAGLDVLETEPPARDNPLLTMPNVILSPHSAGSTDECMDRMAVQAARNILDALDGRPDPAMVVNAEVLGAT